MCRYLTLLVSVGTLVLVSGCGDGGPKLVGAKGVVKQNGNPLGGATVVFHVDVAPGETVQAQGVTNDQGEFSLTTSGKIGAPLGKAKVTVSKFERLDDVAGGAAGGKDPTQMTPEDMMKMQMESMNSAASAAAPKEPKQLVAGKYTNPTTTDLSAEITSNASSNEFVFEVAAE